jgi:putative flippase GtrA
VYYSPSFVRFILFGGLNTLATYCVYGLCLQIVSYKCAYTISYLSGIVLSYVLNTRFVFRETIRVSSALLYPLVYVLQYFVGLGLIFVFVEVAKLSRYVAPLVVLLVTIPVTYLFSRYVIAGKSRGSSAAAVSRAVGRT